MNANALADARALRLLSFPDYCGLREALAEPVPAASIDVEPLLVDALAPPVPARSTADIGFGELTVGLDCEACADCEAASPAEFAFEAALVAVDAAGFAAAAASVSVDFAAVSPVLEAFVATDDALGNFGLSSEPFNVP